MSSTFSLAPVFWERFFDGDGEPLSGGLLFSYAAGTTTPLATYTDDSGMTPNTNPVVLDADGYADVWMSANSYKFVLADSLGNILKTVDNVKSIQQLIADQIDLAGALAATNNLSDVADKAESFDNISPMTALGDIIYGDASGAGTRLPGNTTTTKQFLVQTGDGTTSAAPIWYAIQQSDVLPDQTGNDGKVLKTDGTTATWQSETGGGGGGALEWIENENAPVPAIENNLRIYVFQLALGQSLYAQISVPPTYVVGKQITLTIPCYSGDTSNTILMQTIATLIRHGTDAVDSTANQRTSTNLAQPLRNNIATNVEFDLTDTDGKINNVSVSPNDYIIVQFTRATDSSSFDAKALVYGASPSFS